MKLKKNSNKFAIESDQNRLKKIFGDIHIDVKNAEETESEVIFPKKSLKNGQNNYFIEARRKSWDLTSLNKTILLTIFK